MQTHLYPPSLRGQNGQTDYSPFVRFACFDYLYRMQKNVGGIKFYDKNNADTSVFKYIQNCFQNGQEIIDSYVRNNPIDETATTDDNPK
jgi:hypothetical protein